MRKLAMGLMLLAVLGGCSENKDPLVGNWTATPADQTGQLGGMVFDFAFNTDGTFRFSPDPNNSGGAGKWTTGKDKPDSGFDAVVTFIMPKKSDQICSYKVSADTLTFGGCEFERLTFTRKS